MGLDAVEIILRCEETFDIPIEDQKAGQIATVSQRFEQICAELHLPSGIAAPTEPDRAAHPHDSLIAKGLRGWPSRECTPYALTLEATGAPNDLYRAGKPIPSRGVRLADAGKNER